MKAKSLLHCLGFVVLFGGAAAAEASKEEIRLVGVMTSPSRFVLFATLDGVQTKQLDGIGSSIGPFELVAVDCAKGYADFKRGDEAIRRVWLPESRVKSGGNSGPELTITIPPLTMIKGLIGLEESIAERDDKEAVEKRARDGLNRQINNPALSWEERTQLVADLISGKKHNILVPRGGITESFAKKYGLTSQEMENGNWGEEVGREFAKGRKEPSKP